MVFPGVNLRRDEEELLILLVKAENAVSPRRAFLSLTMDQTDNAILIHDGLGTGKHEFPGASLLGLERAGLAAFRDKTKSFQG